MDFTLEFLVEFSQAVGTFFGEGPILLGYDGRKSSPAIAKAAAAGLLGVGLDVFEAGLVPTPGLQFAVRSFGYRGGGMITASHNPPQYNGIKVMGQDGVEISREQELAVEGIYYEKRFKETDWKGVGTASLETRVVANYLKGIMRQIDAETIRKRAFKVVVDLGNGAQAVAAPYLLEELGCKVVSINGQVDGDFPGRGAEPTPDTLTDLSAAVKATGADLGVGYDGDGDRAIFCDEKGVVHWGDRTGAMLTDYVLSRHPGGEVVTTVSTSRIIDYVAEKRSSKVTKTRVGSVDVSRAMINNGAVFGLEENGGCCYAPHIPTRDGAMTTALMLDLLSKEEKPFSDILQTLPRFHQRKAKFECPREKVKQVMQEVSAHATGRVEHVDGIKIWSGNNSWILLRPSGTEPVIRVFAESDSEKGLDSLFKHYGSVLEAVLKTV